MKRFGKKLFTALLLAVAALSLGIFAACETKSETTVVTVDFNGGTLNSSSASSFDMDPDGDIEAALEDLGYNDVSRLGYTFEGWELPEKTDGVYADSVTVKAQWTIVHYSVAYDYDGGTLPEGTSNPASYTVEDDFTLVTPEKYGYRFDGYVDAATNEVVTAVGNGTVGEYDLQAKWTKITTTVNFYLPGAEEAYSTKTFDFGQTIAFEFDEGDVLKDQVVLGGYVNRADGSFFTATEVDSIASYDLTVNLYNNGMEFDSMTPADFGEGTSREMATELAFSSAFYAAHITGEQLGSSAALYYPAYYEGVPVEAVLDVNDVSTGSYFADVETAYFPASVKLIWTEINPGHPTGYPQKDGLFHSAVKLTAVTFEKGSKLQEIHEAATFSNTVALTSVALPDTLQYLGQYAFAQTEEGAGLTSFRVPLALIELPSCIFDGAQQLASIEIPVGARLTKFSAPTNGTALPLFTEVDLSNALYLKEIGSLAAFQNVATYKFPASVESIRSFASTNLINSALKELDLSNTKIAEFTSNTIDFKYLSAIETIHFPKVLETIGSLQLFGTSQWANTTLTELDFSDTKLKSVCAGSFVSLSALKTVKFPDTLKEFGTIQSLDGTTPSVTSGVFNTDQSASASNNKTLAVESIDFGNAKLETLGDFAFFSLSALKSLKLGVAANGSVGTSIFAGAGDSAQGVFDVSIEDGANVSPSAFIFTQAGEINFKDVVNFGGSALATPDDLASGSVTATTTDLNVLSGLAPFYGSALHHVNFDSALRTIGNFAFALVNITPTFEAPEKVSAYGDYLFYQCQLTSFDFTGTPFSDVKYMMFYGSSELAELKGFDVLVNVADLAFAHTGVKNFTLGSRIREVSPSAFQGNGDINFTYENGVRYTTVFDDDENPDYVIYSYGRTSYIFEDYKADAGQPFERDFSEAEITEVGTLYAANTNLQSIVFPDTVTTVTANAFEGCTALTSVTFNAPLTEIGAKAFYGCSALTSFDFDAELTKIGEGAFQGSALTSFVVPEGSKLTSVGADAFGGLSLAAIDLGKATSLETLGAKAFANIPATVTDTTVTLPENSNLTKLSAGLFMNDKGIKTFKIPASVTALGEMDGSDGVFRGCTNLKTVELAENNNLTSVGNNTFHATVIEEFDLSKVLYIGVSAFAGTKLTDIVLNPSVQISDAGTGTYGATTANCGAFSTSTATIISVTFAEGEGKATIGDYAFYNQTNLDTFAFENVADIGIASFYNTGFTDVTLASGTTVGRAAFAGCTKITSVTLSADVVLEDGTGTSLATQGVFGGCTNLQTLTIEGDGKLALANYSFASCAKLETVPFDKISSIGTACFYSCSKVVSASGDLDLSGVSYIGGAAFAGCTAIKSIILASDVVIGDGSSTSTTSRGAFAGNTNLASVMFAEGEGKATIGAYAFYGDAKLASVTFAEGEGKATIGAYAFYGNTALKTLDFTKVASVGNDAFHLGSYGASNGFTNADLSGLTEIADKAFYNQSFTSLDLTSIDSIGASAFYGNKALSSLTLKEGVTLGKAAFADATALETLALPNGVTFTDGSSNSGENRGAFGGCTALESVTFGGMTELGAYAFYGCTALTSVDVDHVAKLGNYVFSGCSALQEAVIPAGLEVIPQRAFENCVGIMGVEIPASVTEIGTSAFQGCIKLFLVVNKSSLKLTIGDTGNGYVAAYAITITDEGELEGAFPTSEDGNYSFMTADDAYFLIGYKGSETNLTLPESIKLASGETIDTYGIGDYAFYNNANLKSITLPEDLTSIGNYAFQGCTALTTVTIPASVKSIGNYAFTGATKLESVTFAGTSTCTSIGIAAFQATALKSITIPASVQTIANGTKREEGVFYNCKSLATVDFEEGSALLNIPAYGFYQCTALQTFDFGALGSLQEIGKYAFYEDAALDLELSVPASVTLIGEDAFFKCTKIKSLTFNPKADGTYEATHIEKGSFAGCSALQTLSLPATFVLTAGSNAGSSATSPGNSNGAFGWCTGLTSVDLNGRTSVSAYTFYGCTSLETVNNYSNLTALGDYAFYQTKLSSFAVPDSLVSIGQSVFRKSASLKEVTFGSNPSIESIGNYAFAETGLTTVTIPATVTTLGQYVFQKCTSLAEIVFADGSVLESIGNYAFSETAITSITLPASVKTLGTNVFNKCASLVTVDLSATQITALGASLFEMASTSATALTTVKLPSTLTADALNANAIFKNCAKLTDIWFAGDAVLANPAKTSSNRIFYGCNSLTIHVKDASKYEEGAFKSQFSVTNADATFVNIEAADADEQA